MNYYSVLQSLAEDVKKLELIITRGEGAGSKALFADGRLAARTERGGKDLPALFADLESDQKTQIGSLRGNGTFVREGRTFYYEQLDKAPRLVICGAGHVGLALCRIASMTGLETIVLDDRPEFTSLAEEAGAAKTICAPFVQALQEIDADDRTCFVLMTRGHQHGMECLRTVLQRPHLYVGMMSSRSRAAAARESLLSEGFSKEAAASVYMPVGLPIGSVTPQEIAVSVLAQVISVIRSDRTSEGYSPEMLEALQRIDSSSPAGAVLATIVHKEGEAPRDPGTRMVILPDGSQIGTIGGGYAEAVILQAAADMLRVKKDFAGAKTCPAPSPFSFLKVEMPSGGKKPGNAAVSADDRPGTGDFADELPAAGLSLGQGRPVPIFDESMICGGEIMVLLELV